MRVTGGAEQAETLVLPACTRRCSSSMAPTAMRLATVDSVSIARSQQQDHEHILCSLNAIISVLGTDNTIDQSELWVTRQACADTATSSSSCFEYRSQSQHEQQPLLNTPRR